MPYTRHQDKGYTFHYEYDQNENEKPPTGIEFDSLCWSQVQVKEMDQDLASKVDGDQGWNNELKKQEQEPGAAHYIPVGHDEGEEWNITMLIVNHVPADDWHVLIVPIIDVSCHNKWYREDDADWPDNSAIW